MRARPKIVRPIDTPRFTAASVGVARKMGDVLNHTGARWEPRLLANLYAAAAAVEADDAHGVEHDLVTQHYDVRRADLAAVIELAERALDGRHGVPARCIGSAPLGMPSCRSAAYVVPWSGLLRCPTGRLRGRPCPSGPHLLNGQPRP